MKKSYAILIAILLIIPMLSVAAPVRASTGAQIFATWNGSAITIAYSNVTIRAGSDTPELIDNTTASGQFAMILSVNGSLDVPVKFAGAGFDLYISKDYYSGISADDKLYATGFAKSDVYTPGLKEYNITNSILKGGEGQFYVGTVTSGGTTYGIITGPIPFDITNDYKYIKIYDGSAQQVAVAGIIIVLPAFLLTPDSGPPCRTVTLSGVALGANRVYEITYGEWKMNFQHIAYVNSTADGKLTYSWQIIDNNSSDYAGDYDWIGVRVWDNATGVEQTEQGMIVYQEYQSYFTGIWTDYEDSAYDFVNNTGPYDVYVFSEVQLNGSYFCVSCGQVTISVDGITIATPTLNSAGNFTAEFTIPELTMGNHVVKVNDCMQTFTFNITVWPTLVVTPNEGPVGTVFTVTAYGFDPANKYAIVWEGLCYDEEDSTLLGIYPNATVGTNGKFNMTSPITFTVPHSYGGDHEVQAWININWTLFFQEGYNFTTFPDSAIHYGHNGNFYAEDDFYVTPTVFFTPLTIDSDGTTFTLNGNGLNPDIAYAVNIDNQALATGYENYYGAHIVFSDECGDLTITLVAAGFQPGLHVGALYWDAEYWDDGTYGEYGPAAYGIFTVTTDGDPIAAQITSIQNGIVTLQTTTGQIQTSVNALDAKVVALQGSVATVQTTLGTMTGQLTALQGDMATVKTDVGTINAKVSTTLPVDMLPVWIAVIFAIIAAIASIYGVLVIRSKIAQ